MQHRWAPLLRPRHFVIALPALKALEPFKVIALSVRVTADVLVIPAVHWLRSKVLLVLPAKINHILVVLGAVTGPHGRKVTRKLIVFIAVGLRASESQGEEFKCFF